MIWYKISCGEKEGDPANQIYSPVLPVGEGKYGSRVPQNSPKNIGEEAHHEEKGNHQKVGASPGVGENTVGHPHHGCKRG